LASKSKLGYKSCLKHLTVTFGKRLVCDIGLTEVVQYRTARLDAGASPRTVNYEVGTLRGILKTYGLWAPIGERIKKLRENNDVGRALSHLDEQKLLAACRASKAPALLPLFIFGRDTGLRKSEMKALRRRDLKLEWNKGIITAGEVIVPKSKTEAGTGRTVPFTRDVCSTLTIWLSRFPRADEDSFVFPRHGVELVKGGKETRIVRPVLSQPIDSWKRAWHTALKAAGVKYRWHDLRHTFITRLAENPAVSEQTIRALAGHVSKLMLERYSHIRGEAKREAIAALHSARTGVVRQGAQKWAQSRNRRKEVSGVTH
jgi:integrase